MYKSELNAGNFLAAFEFGGAARADRNATNVDPFAAGVCSSDVIGANFLEASDRGQVNGRQRKTGDFSN
jgi:hypothetical protein